MSLAVALKQPPYSTPSHMIHETHQFHPRQRLAGRYELVRILGSGGCARVYLAIDHQATSDIPSPFYVAVKILRPELRHMQPILRAFQKEYSTLSRINHINTVKIYALHQEENATFLVMEALEGRTLGQLFRDHAPSVIPKSWGFLLIKQMITALNEIHRHDLIHGDIKPGNLFFNKKDGQLKIVDLGLAREKSKVKEGYDPSPMAAITPTYASLEVIKGVSADPRDDIYSMACVVYELLTGYHPYNRLPADQAYLLGLEPEPVKGLQKGQWKVLKQALAFHREDRVKTVAAFQKAFFAKNIMRTYWRVFLGIALVAEALFQGWIVLRG